MKTKTILTAIASAMLLLSCSNETEVANPQQQVQLRCTTEPEVTITRATLAAESITDLWIWEGTTLVKHQVSGDDNFGSPLLSLDYGTHNLTIVASKVETQSWANGVWTTASNVKDTYAAKVELEVTKGMDAEDIELSRANAKVRWTVEDMIPTNCATVTCSVGSYKSLTSLLAGANAYTFSYDFSATSIAGQKNHTLTMSLFPATFGIESQTATSITFKDSESNTLVKYEKEVPVLSNRMTNIHGEFFGTQGTGAITVSTDWLEPKDIDL